MSDPKKDAPPLPPDATITSTGTEQGSVEGSATDERAASLDATAAASEVVELQSVASDLYRLEGEHARGGLGVVLRAHDRRLDRTVAVKELLVRTDRATRRFVREMRITARLQHPSIVPVHEAGRWPSGEPFYSMKLVEGRSLKQVIAETKSFAERLALLPNVIAVAEAVAYAHSQDIIHRDLKPSNVLIGAFGETVVIDWGLAKHLTEDKDDVVPGAAPYRSAAADDEQLTILGNVIGTPAYMPPEQAAALPVDKRADVYAIGAMLYHVLGGVPPYFGRKSLEIVEVVAREPPRPLADIEPAVPKDLLAVVAKAMARDPEARYASADLLAEELKRFQTGQLVSAREYDLRTLVARWLRRHRTTVTLVASFLALLVLVSVVGLRGIIRERTVAQQQRALAEQRGHEASVRANELTLTQARASLETDPTRTLAWLKTYPLDGEHWIDARNIAADALSRGVARMVLTGHRGTILRAAFSADGTFLYSYASQDDVRVWDARTGRLLHRATVDEQFPTVKLANNGTLAYSGMGSKLRLWSRNAGEQILETGSRVSRLDFSHDSQSLAVASPGSPIQIWDLTTRMHTPVPCESYRTPISTMTFSRDDALLVSGGDDGTVRVWDRRSGACRQFAVIDGPVALLSLAPQGDVALVQGHSRARLLDLFTGSITELNPGGGSFAYALFSPDGGDIAFACEDGVVRIVNRASGAVRMLTGLDNQAFSLAFSPDGTLLASGSRKGVVKVWSLRTEDQWTLRGHRSYVGSVFFSPDGATLVTSSSDKEIRLWPTPAPASVLLPGETNAPYQVVFSRDGRQVAVSDRGGQVVVWDRVTRNQMVQAAHVGPAKCVAFSPDGHLLASCGWDGPGLWDLTTRTGKLLEAHQGHVNEVKFTPDGKTLLTAGEDGLVYQFSVDGALENKLQARGTSLGQLAVSGDGRWIAAGAQDGAIYVWTDDREPASALAGHEDNVSALEFAHDGLLVSASWDGTVRLWDVRTATGRVLDKQTDRVLAIDVSPDGQRVASADASGLIVVSDTAGASRRVLLGHTDEVGTLSFSPDGQWLVSASVDRTARLWKLETGESWVLRGHLDKVTAAVFSPDGSSVATASEDRTVRLWDKSSVPRIPSDRAALRRWLEETTNVSALH